MPTRAWSRLRSAPRAATAWQYFERQHPATTRYWELVGVLNEGHPMAKHFADWGFLVQALKQHVPAM
jgi:hypothetical protein